MDKSITPSTEMSAAEPIKVYWQPGCSSCVKVKEFLTELGVSFVSVNVVAEPAGMKELLRLGLRSVPAVVQGDRYVLAQSLPDVAEFVGKSAERTPVLTAIQLVERWLRILYAAQRYIAMMPPERLNTNVVPGRERTLLDVSYHIFQIPDGFLQTVEGGLEDWRLVTNVSPPDSARTVQDILTYAKARTDEIERWWQGLEDRTCAGPVKMYYGEHSVHSFLERSTWHSAQHARQLDCIMKEYGLQPADPLVDADYADLPMPKGLWE